MIKGFKRFWVGEQPLARAFWLYFIVGWIAAIMLAIVAFSPLYLLGLRPLGRIIFMVAFFGYPWFAALGTWRSANKESASVYQLLTKLAVIGILGRLTWGLANGGALGLMDYVTQR